MAPPTIAVPVGEDALFLAPLPLETLPLPVQARLALRRLGVRTLGAFAALPANSIAHRFKSHGEEGRLAHRLAKGGDTRPLRPRRPTPAARVALTFEWEESDLDRLTFALKHLATQLATRIQALKPDLEDAERTNEPGEEGDGSDSSTWEEEGAAHPDFWPEEETQLSAGEDIQASSEQHWLNTFAEQPRVGTTGSAGRRQCARAKR